MSVTAIWTAHCDRCAFWEDGAMGDTKAEATAKAKRLGWVVTKDSALCRKCAKAGSGVTE